MSAGRLFKRNQSIKCCLPKQCLIDSKGRWGWEYRSRCSNLCWRLILASVELKNVFVHISSVSLTLIILLQTNSRHQINVIIKTHWLCVWIGLNVTNSKGNEVKNKAEWAGLTLQAVHEGHSEMMSHILPVTTSFYYITSRYRDVSHDVIKKKRNTFKIIWKGKII